MTGSTTRIQSDRLGVAFSDSLVFVLPSMIMFCIMDLLRRSNVGSQRGAQEFAVSRYRRCLEWVRNGERSELYRTVVCMMSRFLETHRSLLRKGDTTYQGFRQKILCTTSPVHCPVSFSCTKTIQQIMTKVESQSKEHDHFQQAVWLKRNIVYPEIKKLIARILQNPPSPKSK